MTVYFLSDTHLSPEFPDIYDKFVRYLKSIQASADELYILGDLFDYWIGDDGIDLLGHNRAADALADLAASSTKISVMHGNRDFLIGQQFIDQISASLIPDPTTIELNGQTVLLMHGDSLCTDDIEHQEYRKTVLSPHWQESVLKLPVSERLSQAQYMRSESKKNKKAKTSVLMDVNDNTVKETMKEFDVRTLIHGHTHRPAVHNFTLNGKKATRYVLGDWGRGFDAVIRFDGSGTFDLHSATV